MEESEKRKERLRAMRVEAEMAEASHDVATSSAVPGYLSNPLAEDIAAALPLQHDEPSRFDFYTDPMAAFSSDTKRVKVANHIAPNSFNRSNIAPSRNLERTALPAHQFQSNYSPDQRMHQVQGFYQDFDPQRNPIGMARPFLVHHGNPPQVWNGADGAPNYSFPSDPSKECRFPGPTFRPPGSPAFRSPGSPGFGPQGSPGFGQPGSPGFGQPGSPGFRLPGSPGFRPLGSPGSNSRQVRGHWLSNSPSPRSVHGGSPSPSSSSGRGGGRWGMSPGSGWRGGRGLGSHGRPAMDRQVRPERFYNDSMVEDPWKFLKPVVWKGVDGSLNGLNTPDSSKPTIEKSCSSRNASIAEHSDKSTPQPSLAEYLAASLNEAVNDTPST